MVRTIRLGLEYEGTRYSGFAVQPGLLTIQLVVERGLARLLGDPVRVTPAGRTDAGVHARGQVVSFRTEARLPVEALARALNSILPDDIVASGAQAAGEEFDARRSARRRHYRYSVLNRAQPDLWQRRYTLRVPDRLDEAAMNVASAALIGRHDFSSFIGHAAQEGPSHSPVRTVERAEWTRDGDVLHFRCSADAFARHMIRGMVGTLLWVGRGRMSPEEFRAAFRQRDRRASGPTAAAHGLTLMKVDYDQESET